MVTRTEKVKLGVFILTTGALLLLVLVTFVGVNLGAEEDNYTVTYRVSVTGLGPGSSVRLRGVKVGTVKEIEVNPKNVEEVVVTLSLGPGTPVKKDTQAVMKSQGLTGGLYIELEGGTKKADTLPVGSPISAGKGLVDKLMERADGVTASGEEIFAGFEEMTRPENRQRVDRILAKTEDLVGDSSELVKELTETLKVARRIAERNEASLARTMDNAARVSAELPGTVRELRAAVAQGRDVLAQAKIEELVTGLSQTNEVLRGSLTKLDTSALSGTLVALQALLEQLSGSLGQNQEQLRAVIFNMRRATDNLQEVSRALRERPSSLIFDENPPERERP